MLRSMSCRECEWQNALLPEAPRGGAESGIEVSTRGINLQGRVDEPFSPASDACRRSHAGTAVPSSPCATLPPRKPNVPFVLPRRRAVRLSFGSCSAARAGRPPFGRRFPSSRATIKQARSKRQGGNLSQRANLFARASILARAGLAVDRISLFMALLFSRGLSPLRAPPRGARRRSSLSTMTATSRGSPCNPIELTEVSNHAIADRGLERIRIRVWRKTGERSEAGTNLPTFAQWTSVSGLPTSMASIGSDHPARGR